MGLERQRRWPGWTLAWKRPIQLLAALAETRMAFQRFRERVEGLSI